MFVRGILRFELRQHEGAQARHNNGNYEGLRIGRMQERSIKSKQVMMVVMGVTMMIINEQ